MSIDVGEILGRTLRLGRTMPTQIGVAAIAMTVVGVSVDAFPTSGNGLALLNSGLTLGLEYWLIRSMLIDSGFAVADSPRGWAFIGLGIVSGLGLALGLVLLVIPGVILFVRWSISIPCLLSSDAGIVDCLRRSWDQTAGRFWPIFVSMLVIYVPALGIAVLGFVLMSGGAQPLLGSLIGNIAVSGMLIAGWTASVAIFGLLNQAPNVSEVFE